MTYAVLGPERPGRPAPAELTARRAALADWAPDAGPDVTVIDTPIGGVPCRTISAVEPIATVLYLHGGGYRLGTAAAYSGLAGALARAAGAEVVVVDYRLAPEHPFPAALSDAAAVHDALRAADRPLVLAGDSAGGGLAAALLALGIRAPAGVALLSPWLDLRCDSPTFASRAETDPLFPLSSAQEAADQYLQGHRPDDPLASPLRADLDRFPPALVFASAAETLLGDALTLTQRLADAARAVTLRVVPGMAHAWPVVHPDLPESSAVVAEVGAFVRRLASEEPRHG
ncbi:alpha/beta hydrolase fold domain-containing protein [Cryptosporangium minutisporangium]|uniref:Alpha/beta hydrolase n=1 Tax=Cryptosporangium minutisporangium TaxID=113569 RepID=A0ABP6SRI1_9ACTN